MPSRVGGDVRRPDGTVLSDDQAEEAVSFRQRADQGACLGIDPRGDEPFDDPARVDDPQRGVARPDERPNLVDDDLQDVIDALEPGDRTGGHIERVDDTGRIHACLVSRHARNGSRGCLWLGPHGPPVGAAWLMAVPSTGGTL